MQPKRKSGPPSNPFSYPSSTQPIHHRRKRHASRRRHRLPHRNGPKPDRPGKLHVRPRSLSFSQPIDSRLFYYFNLEHSADLEEYLQSTARDGIQALIAALYTLPTEPSPDGPLAQLPPPTTPLPRAKPLPKPKPPTKWERFAASKGIQKKRRDKKVWDEEKQEWVDRWGWGGKNKEGEAQWIHEVKADAGGSFFVLRSRFEDSGVDHPFLSPSSDRL